MYSRVPIEEKGQLLEDELRHEETRRSLNTLPSRAPLLHGIVLFVSALVCMGVGAWIQSMLSVHTPYSLVYSPAQRDGVLKQTKVAWNLELGKPTPYTNGSGSEVDALWDAISAPPGKVGFIKIQKDELDLMGATSIPFSDGSGYLATIDVFHQIHCLDYLRKHILSDSGGDGKERDFVTDYHIAHCLDSVRSYIQCHADTSLLTFKFIRGYALPWPDFRTNHQCYDWDQILNWANERMVDVNHEGMFVHPELGHVGPGEFTENPLLPGKIIEYIE